jgi:hypothetical protein
MATRAKTKWIPPADELICVFEAGIRFGIKMEHRRPLRRPLWTDPEWRKALAKALGRPPRLYHD